MYQSIVITASPIEDLNKEPRQPSGIEQRLNEFFTANPNCKLHSIVDLGQSDEFRSVLVVYEND